MGTCEELMAQMLYDLWLLKIQVSLCNVKLYECSWHSSFYDTDLTSVLYI